MILSDEQVAQLEGQQRSPQNRVLSDAEVAALEAQPAPGYLESLGRGLVEGATFGYDSKLGMDKNARELSRLANPKMHGLGELVGGIIPAILTRGATQKASQAAVAARQAGTISTNTAQNIVNASKGIDAVLQPAVSATPKQAALQGAKVGTIYGALSGSGHNEDDRLQGALWGVLFGAPLGAGFGSLGHLAGKYAQNVVGGREAAKLETQDVNQGALLRLVKAGENDKYTPQDLLSQVRSELPRSNATNKNLALDDAQVEQLVKMHLGGETNVDIAKALNISDATAGRYVNEFTAKQRGPLNIVDRASLVRQGSGLNTQMEFKAATATAGQARATAGEKLLERQVASNARMQDAIDRLVGSTDYEGTLASHVTKLENAQKALYAPAYQAEKPFNLNPVLAQFEARYGGRKGPVPEMIQKAMEALQREVPVRNNVNGQVVTNQLVPPQNLQEFTWARQNVRALKETEAARPKDVRRALNEFYDAITNEVARTNPLWKKANDFTRDGRLGLDLADAATRMSTRVNSPTREGLEIFSRVQNNLKDATAQLNAAKKAKNAVLIPEAQAKVDAMQSALDIGRVGYARSLSDMLKNTNLTNDLTRSLRLPAAQETLRRVLGKKEAAQFLRIVEAEHAMQRTYRAQSQFGSQTTPLRQAIDDQMWAPRITALSEMWRPSKMIEGIAERTAQNINRARNEKMMAALTNENPIQQMDILRAMATVASARGKTMRDVMRPALAASGPVASMLVGGQNRTWDKDRKKKGR